jgi:hypothetical protein
VMGTRRESQEELWIPTCDLARPEVFSKAYLCETGIVAYVG